MFTRKNKKKNNENKPQKAESSGSDTSTSETKSIDRPRICLIDVSKDVEKALKGCGYECYVGTLGNIVEVPYKNTSDGYQCIPNYDFPPNLHEYDIVVIDLQNTIKVPYKAEDHIPAQTKRQKQSVLLTSFPTTIFDPRPLSAEILQSRLTPLYERETVIIVFASADESVTYHPVTISSRGTSHHDPETYDLYNFYPYLPNCRNVIGKDTKIVFSEDSDIARCLQGHNSESTYQIVFEHATKWSGGKYIKSKEFYPLMTAANDNIISFAYFQNKNCTFFMPEIKRKADLVKELFQKVLPAIFPKLFPYSTQFAWLNTPSYRLPNEEALNNEKKKIEEEYSIKLKQIEDKLKSNKDKYQYLHNLLIQTGHDLVKTAENYFKWLGFANVVNVDETSPDVKEEDIQIESNKGLLVIEIKGIGGTSTDSDCSQISKVKYRRAKQRNRFDVFALYIVNHQRYLPPKDRANPPFNKQQIKDSESDERGLLTTYELFKLHFYIEAGIVTKSDARNALYQTGLVVFHPSKCKKLGQPSELHHNGHVVILKLSNVTTKKGMTVILDSKGTYEKAIIKEIQLDGKIVEVADSGEVGLKLSKKVSKSTCIWLSQKEN